MNRRNVLFLIIVTVNQVEPTEKRIYYSAVDGETIRLTRAVRMVSATMNQNRVSILICVFVIIIIFIFFFVISYPTCVIDSIRFDQSVAAALKSYVCVCVCVWV